MEQVQFAGLRINEVDIREQYEELTRTTNVDENTDEVTVQIDRKTKFRDLTTKGLTIRQPFSKMTQCESTTKFFIHQGDILSSTTNTRTNYFTYTIKTNVQGIEATTAFMVTEKYEHNLKVQIDKFYRQQAHPNTIDYSLPTLPSYAVESHEIKFVTEKSEPDMNWYKNRLGEFDMTPFPSKIENMFGGLFRITNWKCRFE